MRVKFGNWNFIILIINKVLELILIFLNSEFIFSILLELNLDLGYLLLK
jgi:hypothetical protein